MLLCEHSFIRVSVTGKGPVFWYGRPEDGVPLPALVGNSSTVSLFGSSFIGSGNVGLG